MKKQNNFLLWISFFLTTAIAFGAIIIPSYIYWDQTFEPKLEMLMGAIGALIFGMIYATYKLKTLNEWKTELDFEGLECDPREKMAKELRRLGYRDIDGAVFPAGFRADYYMSPDIRLEIEGTSVKLYGPKFYLVKLFKRHRRFRRRALKKTGHLSHGE